MVLLVDDQADVRFMLSLFLDDEGIGYAEATSGEEALERIGADPYDLVLLDQRMPPGMSGMEVAERLRADGAQVPIVLYSAFLDPEVETGSWRRSGTRSAQAAASSRSAAESTASRRSAGSSTIASPASLRTSLTR